MNFNDHFGHVNIFYLAEGIYALFAVYRVFIFNLRKLNIKNLNQNG